LLWAPSEDRAVVHLNVADFAVAVERVVDGRLQGRPVIVAAQAATRAAVYDMSEEAFQAGVRKGMALGRARKRCREARIVVPHPDHYDRAMAALVGHARPYAPRIEAGEGNGHLFVDLTGTVRLFGPPADVAWRMRKAVRADLGLDPIWALASNKLVAKVASRLVKPTGEYIVEPGREEDFLRPLPIGLVPGLEREDLLLFREFHVFRAGEAALWTPGQLETVFGRRGRHLHQAVRGIDSSPVLPAGQPPPGVDAEHEFGDDTNDQDLVLAALYRLAEQAGFELRRRGRVARRIAVRLDYSDGVRIVRQRTDPAGTASDFQLFELARSALDLAWTRRVRLRCLKLLCDRLVYPPAQLELFPQDDSRSRTEALVPAIHRIRARFGPRSIATGRTLGLDAPPVPA